MSRINTKSEIEKLFSHPVTVAGNQITVSETKPDDNQRQTNKVFSTKWKAFDEQKDTDKLYSFQKDWYLQLYGFPSVKELQAFLQTCDVIVDAGCGLGYKAAWFAMLAPDALVIGIDYSDAAVQAAQRYCAVDNLYFIKGDIAQTGIVDGMVDYVNCDQVIMHTEDPEKTFSELVRIANAVTGQVACYFYAKKALPRELLDDFFRHECKNLTEEQLWTMSEQLTLLGKRLSALEVEIDVPDIPALGIKGGRQDIQRFIYWNFAKCFWNEELGQDTSTVTNFDWYSPSNAKRFSEQEILTLLSANNMEIETFHSEEACFSGRFKKISP
ncbi:class I SAM-dependent methyltransferase [Alteromonas oceanisediminis]|uniref:class I SAM-dependent methyltransferase n=1 Tax=Alteromonas oceanisediminis TaxID=2836180 RepID=UPI001BDA6E53|nr:class I SAM-dependent methyltransferase [Alteromonas oceanisediminis]MBT0584934.1 methyltransferase domain-containing protein [Alteromonas oceanisediminis]